MGGKRKAENADAMKSKSREGPVGKKTSRELKTQKDNEKANSALNVSTSKTKLPFDYRYIMAPMVGASELPFRLFCRRYGASLCYTPMMMASEFASSKSYRQREFPTSVLDRPLVCHFAANNPKDFAEAAKLAEPHCDAIDLNLGCPQRTAYVGHFGSYLLDMKDRQLVLDIINAGSKAVQIPIFVKIRLLDTYNETRDLVSQLYEAGATLVAIHGRYRATYHRKGAGARDGPALLDQIQKIKQEFPNKLLITNGNTITYDDVVKNLKETNADGLMSAEDILDNPAIFLNRWKDNSQILVKGGDEEFWKRRETGGESLFSKYRKILKIEKKQRKLMEGSGRSLTDKEQKKVAKKAKIVEKMASLDDDLNLAKASITSFADLQANAEDRTLLALEYLRWASHYPTSMRTVIFHTRRMLKVELARYQMMEKCLACQTVDEVETIVKKVQEYKLNPESFQFDKVKAQKDKEALERKKIEEGKRKAYEARMMRKAKREGKTDLEFYLRQGAQVPTSATVKELKKLGRDDQLRLWKEKNHSQHCMAFHLGACQRGRGCAFLHLASSTSTTFDESQEVAG